MELRARKPNRLKKYDYNRAGAYFITIGAKDRHEFFGRIVGGGVLDAPHLFTLDAPSPTTSDGLPIGFCHAKNDIIGNWSNCR